MAAPTYGFWLADANLDHTVNEDSAMQLSPGPSIVEYPQGPLGAVIDTADGRVVIQQPSKDNRRRAWVWTGMRAWMTKFGILWPMLERCRSRYRLQGGLSPYVYLCDGETGELTKSITWDNGQNGVVRTQGWVRCRVIEVSRKLRSGGDVVYDEIRLGFVIDDPSHNVFG